MVPPTITPEQRRERAFIAATTRHRPDDPQLAVRRRNLRAARLESHVRAVIESPPYLTAEQLQRVADVLLRSPIADAAPGT